MGINKSIRPTPSSHVSNAPLILQKSDSLQVTPTNSSQSQTVSKKPPLILHRVRHPPSKIPTFL